MGTMRALPVSFLLLLACDGGTDTDTGGSGDTDTSGDTGTDTSDTSDTSGANTAPGAPVVAIDPAAPSDGADLKATIVTDAVDAEADPVSYRYVWSQNGVERPELDTRTVAAAETADAAIWAVSVFATDGKLEGPAGTSTATVGNMPPTAPVIHFDPAAPVSGDELTLVFDTPANDGNGDVITQTIVWYFDGARNISWDDKTSVAGVYVDGGETFRAVVTVTDGYSDPITVEASVTVANTVPELTSVTITPTDPSDADDLLCTPRGSDPDGGTLSYTYTWYRDGIEATDIGNDDTVPDTATITGEQWECEVEASDGFATVTLLSDATEIMPPVGYRITTNIELTVTTDTAGDYSATGTVNWDIFMSGGYYTDNDCYAVWSILAAQDTHCSGCTYSFDGAYTYDTALSSIVTGCTNIANDSAGDLDFDTRSSQLRMAIDDATFQRYYLSSYYEVSFDERGTGGRGGYYYGRTYGDFYSVVETADAYGNTVLTGYSTYYSYY